MPEETEPGIEPANEYNGSQSQPDSPSSAYIQAILEWMRFRLDQQTQLDRAEDEQAALALQPKIATAEKELNAKNRELITLVSQYQLTSNRRGMHSPDAWQAFRQIYAAGYTLALPLAQTLPGARRYSGLAEQLAKKSLLLLRWSILYSYYNKIIWNFAGLVRHCFERATRKDSYALEEWDWGGQRPLELDLEAVSIEELQRHEEAEHAKDEAQAYARSEEGYRQWRLALDEALTNRGDTPADEALKNMPSPVSFLGTGTGGYTRNRYTLPLSWFGIQAGKDSSTKGAGMGDEVAAKTEFEVDAYTLICLATPTFAEHYKVSRVEPTAHLMLNLAVQVAASELPTEQKVALLDQASGYSLQKIAERRGWTSSLTHLHLSRGREVLKLKLEEELSSYMTIIDVERQAVTGGQPRPH